MVRAHQRRVGTCRNCFMYNCSMQVFALPPLRFSEMYFRRRCARSMTVSKQAKAKSLINKPN